MAMVLDDMRVAIDAGPLDSGHNIRGVGFYTKSLIESLQQLSGQMRGLKVEAFNFTKEYKKLETGYYDIVHIPYFNPFVMSLPKEKFGKMVVTIHDVIPLIYPEHYVPGFRGSRILSQQKKLLETMVDSVITDTETSKKDIVRLLHVPEKKITSIHLAPRSIFKPFKDRKQLSETQKKYNLPNKFVLYVGDINYNKNIPRLIAACDIADVPLIIVGKQAKELTTKNNEQKTKGIRDMIREIQGKPHPEETHFKDLEDLFEKNKKVYRLGFVSDEDLVAIFNLATVYCQPSLYEGFGLGSVEAMASGTAVVNAKTQALVEVADNAAFYANPRNGKQMARQIDKVVRDAYVRASLIRAGERRVEGFSWSKTAQETLSVYRRVFQEERIQARIKKKKS